MTIQQSKGMLLLLNKAKKIRNKNYIGYGFSVIKSENTKVERKVSVKHKANVKNTRKKQLLPKTLN